MPAAGGQASIPFVGLTGGMAAGKSEALAAFERLGAATLSSDAVVHELLASEEVRDRLVERFGAEAAPGGEVDRSAVAALVFDRPQEREWLEQELWPLVGNRIWQWRLGLEQKEPRPAAAIVEVPLLFESGMDQVFDHTIAIIADEALRAERAAARGHHGLDSRSSRQLTQQEKAQRADFVVENNSDIAALESKLSKVLATIGT